MSQLNEPQRKAVLHGAGPLLVFAGAGSGKTRVITYRIARLLAEEGVPPHRILAVTFTNKAAQEMKERLEGLAGEGIARDLWVGTFHSISARLLRRYGAEVGLSSRFTIYDDSDQKAIVNRVIKAAGLDERVYTPKLCLSRIQAQKREGIGPDQVELGPAFDDEMQGIYAEYQRALRAADAVDFDDLIALMVQILERPAGASDAPQGAGQELRSRFDHVLVDEFQDTNGIQYRWVRALSARTGNLCVVGDDDQSIYSWRGADVRNIRDFSRDFPGAEVVKLEQNYRSSGNIVRAACEVIAASADRQEKSLWTEEPPGDKVLLHAVRDERHEAETVVSALRERIRQGVEPGQLAVFYRVNAQSRVLEEALRMENLPYQIVGGMRFFERAEVKNLLSYLRFIGNPKSDADLVRIFNVPTRGLGNKTLDRLLTRASSDGSSVFEAIEASLELGEIAGAAKKRLQSFRDLVLQLRAEAGKCYPSELAQQILEKTGYQESLRTQNTAEADARLENLAELVGSIKEYEAERTRGDEAPGLDEYLERVALIADVDAVKEGAAVLLMTVHSAKGLEFDTVLLTGMEEETFPYRGLQSENNDELEEERRLAYVAITRARRRLHISYAASRTIFGQTKYLAPSRFLTQLPEEVVEHRGLTGWQARASSAERIARQAQAAWGGGGYGRYGYGREKPRRRVEEEDFDQRATYEAAPPEPPEEAEQGSRHIDYEAFDDTASRTPELRRGMAVYHRRFGRGVVEACEGSGKVVARFKGFGQKRVLSEYLELQPGG